MSIVPKSSPPEFASGNPEISMPEFAFRVVEVSNSPESSAAAAVTTFIVEPGVERVLRRPVDAAVPVLV